MAVTKIKKIYVTVSKATGYIADEKKTGITKAAEYITDEMKVHDGARVEYFNCGSTPNEAAHFFEKTRRRGSSRSTVLALHYMQSFKPDEITPDKAFEVGRRTAEQFLKGEYQYMLSVHTDKKHIHCHTVFCNTNMYNYKTFLTNEDKGSPAWKKLRAISDELCREYGLSVIENEKGERGRSYYENEKNKAGQSWKSKIKLLVNTVIYESQNFDDFFRRMRDAGVDCIYDSRPHIKIKLKYQMSVAGQQKVTRARSLGLPYDVDGITDRIERYKRFLSGETIRIPQTKIIDTTTERMQSAENLQLWAKVHNMKTVADIMIALERKGIGNVGELREKIDAKKQARERLIKTEKSLKKEISHLKFLAETIGTYRATKPVWDEFAALKNNPRTKKKAAEFEKEHAAILSDYTTARESLKRYDFGGGKLPQVARLELTIEKVTAEADEYSREVQALSREVGELESMRKALDEYIGRGRADEREYEPQEQERREGDVVI